MAARAGQRQARAQETSERQDRFQRIRTELETKVLPQELVVGTLLPRAQREWLALAQKTTNGSLSAAELDATFGRLPEEQIERELGVLVASSGVSGSLSHGQHIRVIFS